MALKYSGYVKQNIYFLHNSNKQILYINNTYTWFREVRGFVNVLQIF